LLIEISTNLSAFFSFQEHNENEAFCKSNSVPVFRVEWGLAQEQGLAGCIGLSKLSD